MTKNVDNNNNNNNKLENEKKNIVTSTRPYLHSRMFCPECCKVTNFRRGPLAIAGDNVYFICRECKTAFHYKLDFTSKY